METGKRQFVDLAGVVVMAYSFSMSWRAFHAAYPIATRHCWTSQHWHPRAVAHTRGGSVLKSSQSVCGSMRPARKNGASPDQRNRMP
jgi:hypothetical protein